MDTKKFINDVMDVVSFSTLAQYFFHSTRFLSVLEKVPLAYICKLRYAFVLALFQLFNRSEKQNNEEKET